MKFVPDADHLFAVLQLLYVFMSGSYVQQKWVEVQRFRRCMRASPGNFSISACRQSACRNLMDRLPAVIRVLEDITHESSGDMAVDAQGLLHSGFIRMQLSYQLAVHHVREVSPP